MNSDDPIFLVSSVRSGSTLLRLMLDSHPKITNPGECDFFIDPMTPNGEYPKLESYYEWLSTNRIFLSHKLQLDKTLTYPDLVKSFANQFRQENRELVLNVHRNFHQIPEIFPDARYLHLVRDPRDVARSCVEMGWAGNVYSGVDFWIEAEKAWNALCQNLEARQFMDIRYEDMVVDTGKCLADVCEFLGLHYSDDMMLYAVNSSYGLPDSSAIEKWKRTYSDRELQLVEGKIRKFAGVQGYRLSKIHVSEPDWAERRILEMHNRFACWMHRKNKYGLLLCIEQTLSRRIGSIAWQNACSKRKNFIDENNLK